VCVAASSSVMHVLWCAAVFCGCCSVLQRVAVSKFLITVDFLVCFFSAVSRHGACCSVLQCVTVCCSVLPCVAVCCRVLPCVAVCCSVLQCVAACCSVLQCVAVGVSAAPRVVRAAECGG